MVFKGIERNDKNFRHFTFDEDEVITRNGIQYYKVNYGKNSLNTGDEDEEELGYVKCDDVIVMGNKKPKSFSQPQPESPKTEKIKKVKETKTKSKSKSTKSKTDEISEPVKNSNFENSEFFEYFVDEIHSDHVGELQNKLNEKGSEGWELCGFDTNKSLFGDIHIIVIFKRKRG